MKHVDLGTQGGDLIVRQSGDAPIRIRDVATVLDTVADPESAGVRDGTILACLGVLMMIVMVLGSLSRCGAFMRVLLEGGTRRRTTRRLHAGARHSARWTACAQPVVVSVPVPESASPGPR